jgi:creatinine amidohydrolase
MAHRAWGDLTTADFAGLPPSTVAVLPVGAVEQHGPHLPLDTDATIAEGVLAAALARTDTALEILVLPIQHIGASVEHLAFPGTLSVAPDLLMRIWIEIGASVAAAGVRRLVIVNGHGGQPEVMALAARELRVRAGLLVTMANWFDFGEPPDLIPPEERRFGIHGGLIETSVMLHLAPDRVRREAVADFPSAVRDWAARFPALAGTRTRVAWATQDLNPSGAVGDPRSASATIGAALVAHAAAGLARLIEETSRFPLPAPMFNRGG